RATGRDNCGLAEQSVKLAKLRFRRLRCATCMCYASHPFKGAAMYRHAAIVGISASFLIVILTTGAGVWGLQQGLIHPPTGIIRLGQIDVMGFTAVEYSTMRSPRAYYTVWVGLAQEPMSTMRPGHRLAWARRLVQLRVPPSAVLMR